MPTNTEGTLGLETPVTKPARKRAPAKKSASAKAAKPTVKKSVTRSAKPKAVATAALPHELATIWEEIAPRQSFATARVPLNKPEWNYWHSLGWLALALVGVLLITTTTTLFALQNSGLNQAPTAPEIQPAPVEPTALAPLTGLTVAQSASERRPWAVIVENFPDVRPQSGLSKADIVFESPTEGGITRFLAIFQSQLPTEVGPVRSARSFFNDWARPFAPLYSHSGGSEKALKQLSQGYGNIQDVNEFYNAAAYVRKTSLPAPHNLFAPVNTFINYITSKKWLTSPTRLAPITFATPISTSTAVNSIAIPYTPREYSVRYDYRTLNGTYLRAEDGTTLTDALTREPIEVKNVVTLFTDITPIAGDALKRVDLRTTGKGPMVLYTGGRAYAGTWSKKTVDDMITFTDAAGNAITLAPGNTWISVLDVSQQKQVKAEAPELAP